MRRLAGLPFLLGITLMPLHAWATDIQACLYASEKGQRARADGKLRAAREQFALCSNEGCPAIVRRDCSQWQAEVGSLMPSVVFGAKDKQGRDLFEVAVSIDGEPLVKKLDGKSVLVDPGPHTFTFEIAGQPPMTERALVKEGEKTRPIVVTFLGEKPVAIATPVVRPPSPDRAPETTSPRGHTILPWIVVGAGVVTVITGTTILLTAPSLPPNCSGATETCTRRPNESQADYENDQKQAGQSDAQPTLGLVVGAIGLGLVAGGLLWHFLEPTGPRPTALRVSPWAGPGSSGVSVGGSF